MKDLKKFYKWQETSRDLDFAGEQYCKINTYYNKIRSDKLYRWVDKSEATIAYIININIKHGIVRNKMILNEHVLVLKFY